MMKKSVKIILWTVGGIVSVMVILFVVLFSVLNSQTDAVLYTLGNDQLSSINAVVGTRDITGVSTSTTNGVSTKSYDYKSTTSADDIKLYITHLVENEGFIPTNLNQNDGYLVYAKQSVDEGKIIILDLSDTGFGYTLTIQKGQGTLTMNE